MKHEQIELLAKKIKEKMAGQPFGFNEFAKLVGGEQQHQKRLFATMNAFGYIAVAVRFKDYVKYKIMLGEDRRKLVEKRIEALQKEINFKMQMLNDMRKMI